MEAHLLRRCDVIPSPLSRMGEFDGHLIKEKRESVNEKNNVYYCLSIFFGLSTTSARSAGSYRISVRLQIDVHRECSMIYSKRPGKCSEDAARYVRLAEYKISACSSLLRSILGRCR